MRLGIFAKTFQSHNVRSCLQTSASAGISVAQFNLSIAGIATVPSHMPAHVVADIRAAAQASGVELQAISGTFNTAHPSAAHRQECVDNFEVLARCASQLDIPIITLCSGTRDPDDMWRWHPDNASPEAWAATRETLEKLAGIAERHDLTLAVEPESNNVLATADMARRMLAEVGSCRLKIVFDAANLIDPKQVVADRAAAIEGLRQSVACLAPHIVLAHAKELSCGEAQVGPGQGALPWSEYLAILTEHGYEGSLIMHGLPETDVPAARAFLARELANASGPTNG